MTHFHKNQLSKGQMREVMDRLLRNEEFSEEKHNWRSTFLKVLFKAALDGREVSLRELAAISSLPPDEVRYKIHRLKMALDRHYGGKPGKPVPKDLREETRVYIEGGYVLVFGKNPEVYGLEMSGSITKKKVVGLLMANVLDWFFGEVFSGVRETCAGYGLRVIVADSGDSAAMEADQLKSLAVQTSGVIAVPVDEADFDGAYEAVISSGRVPFVFADRFIRGERFEHVCRVGSDGIHGGQIATEYLIKQGCRRVFALSERHTVTTVRDRINGWKQALDAHGFRKHFSEEEISTWDRHNSGYREEHAGYALMEALIPDLKEGDGVFATNDPVAAGALACLAHNKYRGRVPIVGFDARRVDQYLATPIPSVKQDMVEIGRTAARLLVAQIKKKEPSETAVYVPTQLGIHTPQGWKPL